MPASDWRRWFNVLYVVLQCNVTYLAYSWHVSRARITVLALLSLFRQLHDIRQDIMSGYCSACKLLPRVSMQCMQSAILLWQIRPSVSPKPVLCLNEWIYRQFLSRSGMDIILDFFEPQRRYRIQRGNPLSGRIFQIPLIISETVRDMPLVTMDQ